MIFNIITPSFNQLNHLKRSVASVRDQSLPQADVNGGEWNVGCERPSTSNLQPSTPALQVHHHIQDGGSTDGTVEWLRGYRLEVERGMWNVGDEAAPDNSTTRNLSTDSPQQPTTNNYQLTFSSEADEGMYDAINKGVAFVAGGQRSEDRSRRRMEPPFDKFSTSHILHSTAHNPQDSVVAWLNCDEQYLPGTLKTVADYFERYPETDILCGDVLLIDSSGGLLAWRKSFTPRRTYIEASHLYTLSCATFYRSRVFDQIGEFDVSFKAAADEEFFLRALRAGFLAKHVSCYLSTFALSGENMGAGTLADHEHLKMKSRPSGWVQTWKPVINFVRLVEKLLSGAYFQKFPMEYAIYTDDLNKRTKVTAKEGSWRWPVF